MIVEHLVEESLCYGMECDTCTDEYEGEEFTWFWNEFELIEEANKDGWLLDYEGKITCPHCSPIEPDDEDADS